MSNTTFTGDLVGNKLILSSSYVTASGGTLTLDLSVSNNFTVPVNQNINTISFTNTSPNAVNKIYLSLVRTTGSAATASYSITWPTASFGWNGKRPRNDYYDGENIVTQVELTSFDGTNWIGLDKGDIYSGSGYYMYFAGTNTTNMIPSLPTIYYQPTPIDTNTNWVSCSVGATHVLALKSDGTMWGWGSNNVGQISGSSPSSYSTPIQIGTGSGWSKVFTVGGQGNSYAIDTGSNLYAWGYGGFYQIGDGNITTTYAPLKITSPLASGWKKISATNTNFTYGLTTASTVYIWGGQNLVPSYYEDAGFAGGVTTYPSPTLLPNISSSIVDINGAYYGAIGLSSSGAIVAWGNQNNCETGFPQNTTNNLLKVSPGAIALNANASWSYMNTSANPYVTYLISASGELYVMGYEESTTAPGIRGQGSASAGYFPTASRIGTAKNWESATVIYNFGAIARTTGSTAYVWGKNTVGTSGPFGLTSGSFTPKGYFTSPIYSPSIITGSKWASIGTNGGNRSNVNMYPFVQTDGSIWAWGAVPTYGMASASRYVPTFLNATGNVGNPSNLWRDAVIIGGASTFAIRASDGALFANNTNDNAPHPVRSLNSGVYPPALQQIVGTYDFVRIWPSLNNDCAVFEKLDGSLYGYLFTTKNSLGYDAPFTVAGGVTETAVGYKAITPLAPLPARPKMVIPISNGSIYVLDENGQVWVSGQSTALAATTETGTYFSGWTLYGYEYSNGAQTAAGDSFNSPGFFKWIGVIGQSNYYEVVGLGSDGNIYWFTYAATTSVPVIALKSDGTLWSSAIAAPNQNVVFNNIISGSYYTKIVVGQEGGYTTGILGIGNTATGSSTSPTTQIGTGSGWVDIYSNNNLVFAIDSSSRIYVWGNNGSAGKAGIGYLVSSSITVPTLVTGSTGWKKASANSTQTIFLTR